ncbi:HAD family hydrolase [Butyrivibrio sp. MB2005]|uniref:HAD family hydrolase n=1 Tax=Butyrivibrio sp. MB2005 TaxID=1280678 RepID=UPI000403F6E1|nr:HAD-IA family hydrolase [Butyrivibrio sp. MB2005]
MRRELYNLLVNKVPGIKHRYHRFHDGTTGAMKVLSWGYLLVLNIGYHILFLRFLGKTPKMQIYEKRTVPVKISESEQNIRTNKDLSVDTFVDTLKDYDVISFDVFDTLIFRPLSQPTDVFYFVGEQLGMLDFKNIRVLAEWDARVKCKRRNGHMEVTFSDIWNNLAADTGLDAKRGMQIEWNVERTMCYANPFMLEVWNKLRSLGKEMIIVSDMYLSRDQIEILLTKNGFEGASKIYVSCEYGISKSDGKLFDKVKRELSPMKLIIHVGDNPVSDVKNAKRAGFDTLHYPNINRNELLYRAQDMSYIVGSAYRGLVNAHIYNGLRSYSMEYEYGYIYGGLFAIGYCNFIHNYYKKENLDKLLFLSRDGDVLLKAYKRLYPDDNAEYAYLSRKAVTKLASGIDKHDYFRRFIYHKINQDFTIEEILHSMELDELALKLEDWQNCSLNGRLKEVGVLKSSALKQLKADDKLTDKNADLLRRFIEAKWDEITKEYKGQISAAGRYYSDILQGCTKAAVVDIGWAGSGAMALNRLACEVWNIDCDIRGIVAGTNTVHNAEPDAAEQFLQSGRMVSYMFSQSHNRDILKKHDPDKGYNVFWELLLSSDTPQFTGFYEGDVRVGTDDIYYGALDVTLRFGKRDVSPYGAAEIQRGILDFISSYSEHFSEYPYMLEIGGRDAYAPLLAVAGNNEKYLHEIEKKFELEINVI